MVAVRYEIRVLISVCFLIGLSVGSCPAQLSDFLASHHVEWRVALPPGGVLARFAEVNERVVFVHGSSFRDLSVYRSDGESVSTIGYIWDSYDLFATDKRAFYFDSRALSESTIYSTDGESLSSMPVPQLGYWEYDIVIRTEMFAQGDRTFFRGMGPTGWEVFLTDGETINGLGAEPSGDIYPLFSGEAGGNLIISAGPGVEICDDVRCREFQRQLYVVNDETILPLRHHGDTIHNPKRFVEYDDELFFQANTSTSETEFLKTDGISTTSFGVYRIYEDYAVTDDKLFFWGQTDSSIPSKKVYSTDGTNVIDYGFEMKNGDVAGFLGELRGKMLFHGRGDEGRGIYRTDGEGSALVWQNHWLPNDKDDIIEFAGELYFAAGERDELGNVRYGVYKSDGYEVNPAYTGETPPGGPRPEPIGVVGNALLFSVFGQDGYELLRIDRRSVATLDLPSSVGSAPKFLTEFDGNMFFRSNNGPLLVSDGDSVIDLGNVSVWNGDDALYLVDQIQRIVAIPYRHVTKVDD